MDTQTALALGFQFAKEISTQIISLSTAILALSVTFSKDIIKTVPIRARGVLLTSWVLYLLCVLFGLLHLMSLTGQLAPLQAAPEARVTKIAGMPRTFAGLQILMFLLATLTMVIYGFIALRYISKTQASDDV